VIGRVLSKRYELSEEIGHGGMAVIYTARDLKTNRIVAVKVLREGFAQNREFLQRFRREGYAMMHIQNPNIVQVYDVGYDGDIHYIAMELVRGETLKQYIQHTNGLPIEEAVRIAMALCGALQTAHEHGIIHRDVKPHNVLISREGDVKMTDFGIAKVVGSATITLSGENVLGSVHYIAPEQAQGQEIDERTDIYSLGITLYEMLTGKVPFEADTTVSVALKHIQEEMVPPNQVNPAVSYSLSACTVKACAKDPALRYQSPQAFAEDLQRSLMLPEGHFADLPERDGLLPETTLPQGRRSPKRAIGRIALMSILGISVLTVLFWMVQALLQSGGTLTAVPNVIGLNSARAQEKLKEVNLLVTFEHAFSDTVPEDHVISQSPDASLLVKQKANIKLLISDGPKRILVPDVVGLPLAEAQRFLEEYGLTLGVVTEAYMPGVPDGTVISQDPQENSNAIPGDGVDLIVANAKAGAPPSPTPR
jgi:serine/threonine-protein kinase